MTTASYICIIIVFVRETLQNMGFFTMVVQEDWEANQSQDKVCLVSVFSLMVLFSFREYLIIHSLCYSLYCMYYWFFNEFSYRTGIFALSFLHWWLFANNAYLWCLLITSWNRKSRKYILSQHVYLYLTHSKKISGIREI
jgi:hypothetical protein